MGSALEKELGGAGSSAGDAASKSFGGRFLSGMSSVGKAAGAALSVTVAGAAGTAVALYKVGESFDDAYDRIRVGTGATGQALSALEGDFKAVASSVPASFDDASTAVTDLNRRLGLTGQPLQNLSKQFLDLSRITETDLAGNVETLTRTFGDWSLSVDEMPGALDRMYRASQKSGIGVDVLGQAVTQFGAPLRNLGFGFDESIALIAQFNKTGVNTETVFAGMKAGVGKMAKAGEAVPETFRRVVDEITRLGPGTEATGKAIALFGQRAGPDLADAIAGGKFEIGGMLDAITSGSDTIASAAADTGDFAEKLQTLKNQALIRLEPIALRVFGAVGDAVSKAAPYVTEFAGGVSAMFAAFTDGGNEITSSGFAGILEGVGVRLRDLFDQIAPRVDAVVTTLRGVDWAGLFGQVADIVVPVAEAFVHLGVAVADFAVEQWPKVEAALPAILGAADLFGGVLAPTVDLLADHMNVLGPALVAVAVAFGTVKAAEGAARTFTSVSDSAKNAVGYVKNLNSNYDKFLTTSKSLASTGGAKAASAFDTIRLKAMYAGEAMKKGATQALAWGRAQVVAAASAVRSAAAAAAQRVATIAGTVATTAATAATAAFNFVLALNPVVLVVIALVALVAAVVLAYQKVDWFRELVDKAFTAIRTVAVSAVEAVWKTVEFVFKAIAAVIKFYIDTYVAVIRFGFGLIKSYLIDPVVEAKDAVAGVLDGLADLFLHLPDRLGGALASLADTAAAPFLLMGEAIRDAWNSTIGGKGFDIPNLPGLPGGGTRVEIPRLHEGGPVAGRPGREVLRILEAGEWVLSRGDVAQLRGSGGGMPTGLAGAGAAGLSIGTLQVSTVTNANADETVAAINAKLGWAHTARRDR